MLPAEFENRMKNLLGADYEKFEAAINRIEPAVVYICNPNNPTGSVIPDGKEQSQFLYDRTDEVVEMYDEYIMSDEEFYYDFQPEECSVIPETPSK